MRRSHAPRAADSPPRNAGAYAEFPRVAVVSSPAPLASGDAPMGTPSNRPSAHGDPSPLPRLSIQRRHFLLVHRDLPASITPPWTGNHPRCRRVPCSRERRRCEASQAGGVGGWHHADTWERCVCSLSFTRGWTAPARPVMGSPQAGGVGGGTTAAGGVGGVHHRRALLQQSVWNDGGKGGGKGGGRTRGRKKEGGQVPARAGSASGKSTWSDTRRRCHRCDRVGHMKPDCTTPESEFLPRCSTCTGYGHTPRCFLDQSRDRPR